MNARPMGTPGATEVKFHGGDSCKCVPAGYAPIGTVTTGPPTTAETGYPKFVGRITASRFPLSIAPKTPPSPPKYKFCSYSGQKSGDVLVMPTLRAWSHVP